MTKGDQAVCYFFSGARGRMMSSSKNRQIDLIKYAQSSNKEEI